MYTHKLRQQMMCLHISDGGGDIGSNDDGKMV